MLSATRPPTIVTLPLLGRPCRCAVLAPLVPLIVAAQVASTDAQVSAGASLSARNAQVGQALTLSIEVKGAQSVEAPLLDGLDDFEVQYIGPSTQVSVINGQVSASTQHRYALTPRRPGRFVLGPFTVEHGSQQLQTNRLELVVGEAPPAPAVQPPGEGTGEQLRLIMSVPKTEVYLREVLPLDVVLYVGAVQVSDVQYPALAADGVAIESFGQPRQFSQMIAGQRWDVVQFHTSVTAVQAGKRVLGPATQRMSVIEHQRQGGFFNDPFFSAFASRRRPAELRSNAIELTVLPLPEEGRPAWFSGAVGHFAIEAVASPTEVFAGDPITLRVALQGSGNLADARPPELVGAEGFKVYEPQVAASGAGALRMYEQVLIPHDATVSRIPAVRFSYFDPEGRQYRTVEAGPIAIRVLPPGQAGEARVVAADGQWRGRREELGRDIVYIKDDLGSTYRSPDPSDLDWAFFAWQPVPLLLLAGVLFYDRRRKLLSGDARYARFMQAKRVARASLARAEVALKAGEAATFYDHLWKAVQGYVADKLGLPPGAVDLATIEHSGLSPESAAHLRELFSACEQARFAPSAGDGDMRGLLGRAKAIIARMERECRSLPQQEGT